MQQKFKIAFLIFSFVSFSLISMAQVNNWFYKQLLKNVYQPEVSLLSIEEFSKTTDQYYIIDTRSLAEYEVSHIAGSNFIDFDAYQQYDYTDIGSDQNILVYCSIGARSQDVAIHLSNIGFENVYNLEGGIFEWINQDKEIVNKAGEKTKDIHTFSKAWGIWVNKGNKVQ